MIKVKNIRAGIVIIPDAGLKLRPGATTSVEKLSVQMERALDDGLLARMDVEPEVKPKSKTSPRTSAAKTEAKEQSSKADDSEESAADSGQAGQSSEPETAPAGQQAANGKLALDTEVK
ncbi:MAG: hypothetical protein ACYC64_17710 [Armatimonadota bacterium]